MPTNRNYVDPVRFQEVMLERHHALKLCPDLRVSEEIGGIILKICENLSKRRNFANLNDREELSSAAMLTCISVIDSYDPINYKNPRNHTIHTDMTSHYMKYTHEGQPNYHTRIPASRNKE